MTDEEAMLHLIRSGIAAHIPSREEHDLGIASFAFVVNVTPEVENALAERQSRLERLLERDDIKQLLGDIRESDG